MIFGILAFVWPGVTLAVLVLFWGAYALVDGILTFVAAFRTGQDHRWMLLIEGVVGIGAGIVTFVWPGLARPSRRPYGFHDGIPDRGAVPAAGAAPATCASGAATGRPGLVELAGWQATQATDASATAWSAA